MKKLRTVLILLILFLVMFIPNIINEQETFKYVLDKEFLNIFNVPVEEVKESSNVLETFNGISTGYGPDCDGCIGITASGYDVSNTIYYHDNTYNDVRVIAADNIYPFGTIIRITNGNSNMLTIVLDRGSAIGNDKRSQADILFQSEDVASYYGVQNVKFEVLRYGF